MASLFKKFTNSSRKNSFAEDDYDHEQHHNATDGQFDPNHAPSSWKQAQAAQHNPQSPTAGQGQSFDNKMYQNNTPSQLPYQSATQCTSTLSNTNTGAGGIATGRTSREDYVDVQPMRDTTSYQRSQQQQQQQQPLQQSSSLKQDPSAFDEHHGPAPDALARAFHESIRPYTEQINNLRQQVIDLQTVVDTLEAERLEVFAWIDKRGLRPDVPASVAQQMDTSPGAAESLNAQLDRKITIVNFDLHRLQDDLNDSISSAHFAASMANFLPDVRRLTVIPNGARHAYDLVIKLVGNLNSHGGVEANRDAASESEVVADARARDGFYRTMDEELVAIVRARMDEGENWDVAKEVRRFERNAAFLKNIGIETYFPRALEFMKSGGEGAGSGEGYSSGGSGGQMK